MTLRMTKTLSITSAVLEFRVSVTTRLLKGAVATSLRVAVDQRVSLFLMACAFFYVLHLRRHLKLGVQEASGRINTRSEVLKHFYASEDDEQVETLGRSIN